MKQIKLSGRERSVLRVLDFTTGNSGEELLDYSRLAPEDLVDVLNGLMDVGYMEMVPYAEHTSEATFRTATFEVNPSYSQELRAAMVRTY
jgi:hypothetical protein